MIDTPRSDQDPAALRQLLLELLAPLTGSGDAATSIGLGRLCRSLQADLDLAGVTITLMTGDGAQALAASAGPGIGAKDAVEFDVGEGPSHDAFDHGRPVLVPDLAAAGGRWPGFVSASTSQGVAAVHAFPLQQGAVRVGVLTCFASTVRVLAPREVSRCVTYAEVATRYIVEQSVPGREQDAPDRFLDKDVQIRTEVYQAQGMVMVGLQVSLGEALVRMRAAAFAAGISLNQLAVDLVAGERTLLADDAAPGSHDDCGPDA